jgi:S-adenosylmethionine/arginine decarboxylase-like enzyme
MDTMPSPISFHYAIELSVPEQANAASLTWVRQFGAQLVRTLNLNPVREVGHDFGPGVTFVFVLAESHLAIHTWPEFNYLHLDLLTCGGTDIDELSLRAALAGHGVHIRSLARVRYEPLRVSEYTG